MRMLAQQLETFEAAMLAAPSEACMKSIAAGLHTDFTFALLDSHGLPTGFACARDIEVRASSHDLRKQE